MNKIDEWMQRLRDLGHKPQERVRAFDRDVVMTRTQAHRFRELQDLGFPESPEPAAPVERDWYALDDACRRLGCEPTTLLEAAAAGRLACYVPATGLAGRWADGRAPEPAPACLALPPESCGEIATCGSANVTVLHHGDARFLLREVRWVDATPLLLKHPLTDPGR